MAGSTLQAVKQRLGKERLSYEDIENRPVARWCGDMKSGQKFRSHGRNEYAEGKRKRHRH
jgi:hypothetical protein